jgi:hypothetical protein
MFEQQLTSAARALAIGDLVATDIACRDVLEGDPRNAAALNMLGVVAGRIGAFDQAAAHFRAALRAEPNNGEIRRNLALARKADRPDRKRGASDRYLVIKSWGYGFWSDVSSALGAFLLAEITGRIPVTHWGRNSLFTDGTERDAFALYFKPVSGVTLRELAGVAGATFFPPKWTSQNLAEENVAKWQGPGARAAPIYFLNRPEKIAVSDFYTGVVNIAPWIPPGHPMHGRTLGEVYRYLAGKYLHPQTSVLSACDAFLHAHLDGAPFVAVHVRGSDKADEYDDLAATNQAYLSALAAIDPSWRIFLLTDDDKCLGDIKSAFAGRVVATDCQRTRTGTGVHYLPSVLRVQAGLEVMIDTYLALRADRFIGNGQSNVSAMIALMKDWAPGDCTLIGPSQLAQRNLFLLLSSARR